ncbi:MAG: NADAR family protein [bacterium]|nr:NADAR family protein [bacterium]
MEIRFYRATGEFGFLSNLYKSEIEIDNKMFRSAEDAYQYFKPIKLEVAEWLISAPKPHLCAMAAHSLLLFDIKPNWNEIKVSRMKEVLNKKFQNPELKEKLLSTGTAILIEDSKTDNFWGIGKKGEGKNMLGKLLMEIREQYKKENNVRTKQV